MITLEKHKSDQKFQNSIKSIEEKFPERTLAAHVLNK